MVFFTFPLLKYTLSLILQTIKMSKLLKGQYFIIQNIVFSLQSWLGGLYNAVPLYQLRTKKQKELN